MARKEESAGKDQTTESGATPLEEAGRLAAEKAGEATRQQADAATRQQAEIARQQAELGRAAAQNVQQASQQGAQAVQRGTEMANRIADRSLQQAAEMSKQGEEQLRETLSASTRVYHDVAEASRVDVDVIMQSGARLAQGMQDMGWEMMQFTQQSLRLSLKAANTLFECRTVEDVVQVQRDLVKETVDSLLSESARLLQLSSRLANDAVSPINQHLGRGEPADDDHARQDQPRGGREMRQI